MLFTLHCLLYIDKLSIYEWTEPWNIKGYFQNHGVCRQALRGISRIMGFAGKSFLFTPVPPISIFMLSLQLSQ